MKPLARPSATACTGRTSRKFRASLAEDVAIARWSPLVAARFAARGELVLKRDAPDAIRRERAIADELRGLPNFARYDGAFATAAAHPAARGYLVMPYLPLGSMMQYRWDRSNFELMKSTAKQACFAMLRAFETVGMVHRDLHPGNVMLRRTKKAHVAYGLGRELPTNGVRAVILDFGKSDTARTRATQPREVCDDLRQVINGLQSLENSDLSLTMDVQPIVRLASANAPVTAEAYDVVSAVVDRIGIAYERSKLPPNPFRHPAAI